MRGPLEFLIAQTRQELFQSASPIAFRRARALLSSVQAMCQGKENIYAASSLCF